MRLRHGSGNVDGGGRCVGGRSPHVAATAFGLTLALASVSCGFYQREGNIIPESGAPPVQATFRWLPDGGSVRGERQQTGESFAGRYYDLNEPPPAVFRLDLDSGTQGIRFAYGFLRGSEGTILDCRMLIGQGLPPPDFSVDTAGPHGLGACLDSMGENYLLRF